MVDDPRARSLARTLAMPSLPRGVARAKQWPTRNASRKRAFTGVSLGEQAGQFSIAPGPAILPVRFPRSCTAGSNSLR